MSGEAGERLFAAMVRAVRESRGLTTTQLAIAMGWGEARNGHVSRLESGAAPVSERTMEAVAAGFGVTLRAFLVEAESALRAREGTD